MSNFNFIPCINGPCMTTPWQWGQPYMTSPRYNDKNGPGEDQGVMYLWSPLAIFCVVLGLVLVVAFIVLLAVLIYNYCTYGMCCCPGCSGQGPGCSWLMCCCMPPPQPEKVVISRRGSCDSRSSRGSVRRPRQQIIVDDGRSDDDGDSVVVCRRPSIDRKIVRIADAPEVHTIKVRRPASEMCMPPQNCPQQPIILQPQFIVQPSTIQPVQPACPPPQPRPPQNCFQGGELRVVIGGSGYQQQRPSGGGSKPMVFNMARNQPNEYVLTTVDGGFNGGMQSGGGFSGGLSIDAGFSGGMQSSGRGFYGGDSKDCGCHDDRASSFSDGQRSAIIDIGHGVRSSFYPSLPRYDE